MSKVEPSTVKRFRACIASRSWAALLMIAGLTSAQAATWFVEPSVSGNLTVTNNGDFDANETRKSDVILTVSPAIVFRGEGRRLRLNGALSLGAVTYFEGTQPSSIDPTGRITANVEAIEKWLFLDADLSATRSVENPLAPRLDEASSFNRQTVNTVRISPYIQRDLPSDHRLLIRSDNAWVETRGRDLPPTREYAARHAFQLSREPRPFGWALEAERRRDDRIDVGAGSVEWIDLARLRLRYAVNAQLAIGARGGYEKSFLFRGGETLSFAGAELLWRPSERSRLEGFWEDRSFGDAWQLSFTHRSPFLAWDVRGGRDLTTFDQTALELPVTGDLAGLLDASLRTRIVDPIERARAVEGFINSRGLPRTLNTPINVFTDQVLVRTSRAATVTWIGRRSTVALSGFYQQDATPTGDVFTAAIGGDLNLRQRAADLVYSVRATSQSSISAGLGWTRTIDERLSSIVVGLGSGASRQRTARLQYDRQLAPRTTGFVGARYRVFDSEFVTDASEVAFFAGLGHRF